MARGAMTLEEFLGHSNRAVGGGGAQFLRKWKDRKPPAVNTAFHTRAPFIALWQHGIPRIQVIEKEGEDTRREVWGGTWNCLEEEEVLRSQYFRTREGERKVAPKFCPMCLLIEHVRMLVVAGDIRLTTPVFKWEGDEEDKARVLTAGGMFGAYGGTLSEDEKREVRKTGISLKEAWKENAMSKCNYLFVVADVDDLKAGVQVAIETTLLGDKVREVIRDQMTALGDEDGNPMRKPYCIRWEYRPDEKEFSKKYKALAMPKIVISDQLRELITEADPPDVARIAAPGNVAALRAMLEEHALIELPWDDLFRAAEREASGDDAPEARPSAAEVAPAARASSAGAVPAAEPSEPAAAKPADDDMVACDKCKKAMRSDEFTCPHCGVEYDPKTGQLLPTKPKPRSRSEAAASPAPKAATAKAAPKPKAGGDWPGGEAGPDDEIPFD